MTKKYKVVVCGTTYGQVYLSAFLSQQPGFKLSGIMGRGSETSRKYATEFGVPLYTNMEEIPNDIDIACIVVRSTIAGGDGTYLAERFLERRINVIQEHPVHDRDIQKCLELASKNSAVYHVNSHYVNVDPVYGFIQTVNAIKKQQKIIFIDASASLQTAYSLVDIIGQSIGGVEPYRIYETPKDEGMIKGPFNTIQGAIQNIPFTIKIQNFYDPDDFDNHFLTMHRISVYTNTGNLTLVDTHGPVVWSHSFSIENDTKEEPIFQKRKTAFIQYTEPTVFPLTRNEAPSLREVSIRYWPPAISRALVLMKQQIETGNIPYEQSKEYLMGLSGFWLNITRQVEISKVSKPELSNHLLNVNEQWRGQYFGNNNKMGL